MPRPSPSDAGFGQHYIALAQGNSAKDAVNNHAAEILAFYTSLPAEKKDFAYGEDKWTIIELLQHVIDAERVFTYRALRFARKDITPLPGFDENDYAANSMAAGRDFDELKEEFTALRRATDIFVSSLSEEQLQQGGTSNNKYITVNALAFIIYGHLLHHINIIKERYLPA
ncbi:MAG TPA: DinB family protein [Chitinophagaceae bacterium]|nr:DinB family protein [Chitinophagaceae bacterium]